MDKRDRCRELRKLGWSIRLIADEVGLSYTGARHHVKDITVDTVVRRSWCWSDQRYTKLNLNEKRLPTVCPIPYSEDVAYLMGLYLGDGYYSCGKFGLVCGDFHPNLLERWSQSFVNVFGVTPHIRQRKDSKCKDIYLYDKKHECKIGDLLSIESGAKTHTCSVPQWIKSNLQYSIQCVLGLMESDGHVHHCYKKGGWYWTSNFTSASVTLLNDFRKMTINMGLHPKEKGGKVRFSTKDTLTLLELTGLDKTIEYVYN